MERDPVCGMKLNENEAVAREEYGGKTYHFCSISCRDEFRKEPRKYAKAGGAVGEKSS